MHHNVDIVACMRRRVGNVFCWSTHAAAHTARGEELESRYIYLHFNLTFSLRFVFAIRVYVAIQSLLPESVTL